jgi:hypothetical protein
MNQINSKKREIRIDQYDPKNYDVMISGFNEEEVKEIMEIDVDKERY